MDRPPMFALMFVHHGAVNNDHIGVRFCKGVYALKAHPQIHGRQLHSAIQIENVSIVL